MPREATEINKFNCNWWKSISRNKLRSWTFSNVFCCENSALRSPEFENDRHYWPFLTKKYTEENGHWQYNIAILVITAAKAQEIRSIEDLTFERVDSVETPEPIFASGT